MQNDKRHWTDHLWDYSVYSLVGFFIYVFFYAYIDTMYKYEIPDYLLWDFIVIHTFYRLLLIKLDYDDETD